MLIPNILADQHIRTETIKNEHKRLMIAWDFEISRNSIPDMKRFNISNLEHMVHLFNNHLNQIWDDSQGMLKYEEHPKSENAKENSSADAVFCTNIVALNLMRQSIHTRQAFFQIVDGTNNFLGNSNNEVSESFLSDSTVSQDLKDFKEDRKNERVLMNFEQPDEHNLTRIDHSDMPKSQIQFVPKRDSPRSMNFVKPASSINLGRPIRLTSSPSTPIISSNCTSQFSCSQNFSPACNYSSYFPRMDDIDFDHKLSCYFCQEALPLKKSFSVQDMNSFRQNYTTDDDSEKEYHDDSSFEIASFYYNSDNEDEVIEREELLEKYQDSTLSEKYQIPNDTEDGVENQYIDMVI
ncbi:hypothetical protein INT47_013173 [Mucor saturninus]|uniref:Uncharacterized protein n=1 Tax=Mucor saturninus TaxID=64648 RepID=A0A8H7QUH5_9FUNG|nr:hypothetical protein INT47_013173 [Mucor saturninus]